MNYYMDVNIIAEQRRDQLREIATERLLRRAGVDELGWLRVEADKVVCRLGEALVAMGGRLLCREPEIRTAFATIAY